MKLQLNHSYLIASGLFLLLSLVFFLIIFFQQHGFTYPLDDPYIHLSISDNFAHRGIWGISGGEFSASSSSPVWTLILSFFALFPINSLFVPLVINIFVVLGLVYFLKSKKIEDPIIFSILFLTPLIPLVFTGMEHIIQVFISLFLFLFLLEKNSSTPRFVYLLLFISGGIRYEFLFFAVCLGFFHSLQTKSFLPLITFIFTVALIPIFFGIIHIMNSWDFLPSGVMIKGNHLFFHNTSKFFLIGFRNLLTTPHIFIPLMILTLYLAYLNIIKTVQIQTVTYTSFGFLLSVSLLHLFFAQKAWFYRYETYLIPMIILFSFRLIQKNHRWVLILILFPMVIRSFQAHRDIPLASQNIHDQQKRLSLFLKEVPGKKVLLNDAGLMTWKTGIQFYDFYGLGTRYFYKQARDKNWDLNKLEYYIYNNKITLALIYKNWFENRFGKIPDTWRQIGVHQIKNNIICGNSSVHIYVLPSGTKSINKFISKCNRYLSNACAPE
ncbi:hypothetical protein KKF34_00500 [Myxococcota bacterium]|nr:hypothetical protein [Myxococcota bacterium]MBU1382017.1 hypothetical protein [Myxococcota bacterium]MBU1495341.1 hypothetical protein [Myxococcota bacterium]